MGGAGNRRARRQARGTGREGRHGRTGGGWYLLMGLIFLVLLGCTLYAVRAGGRALAGPQDDPGVTARPDASSAGRARGASTASAAPDAAPTTPAPPATTPDVPQRGTGTFTTADAAGRAVGHGTVRRYEVQVEGGAGVSASAAAREIQGILGDPRGWTADGRDAFQLVSSGPVDFVIKIATPDTVDGICGAAGLHTHGEVNCDVGPTVVVNLKRWLLGSPQFPGPIHGYRALIINHEVGHRIGHGHEGCPGPGRLAPVMMQQIDGLHGCKANAWPYDADGRYVRGPSVP
jgi:hypothetical protein